MSTGWTPPRRPAAPRRPPSPTPAAAPPSCGSTGRSTSPPAAFPTSAVADATTYGYGYTPDPLLGGQATKTVTDAQNNVWTTTSDLLGRTTANQDPDAGTTVSTYDDAGDLLGTADGRGRVLAYSYGTAASDPLRRKAAEYDGGTITGYTGMTTGAKTAALTATVSAAITGANQLTAYTYDKSTTGAAIPNARGQQTSATRYTAGATGPKYVTGITPTLGFTATGKVLGSFTTIPTGDGNGALAGTYTTADYYTPLTGLLDHTDLTSGPVTVNAGMAAETVDNTYNVNGLLLASGGNADYLVDATYDALGRPTTTTVGDYPYQVVQSQLYDPATGRVTKTFADATAGTGTSGALNQYGVDDTTYTYDAAGLLTSTSDLQNANVSNPAATTPAPRPPTCSATPTTSRPG